MPPPAENLDGGTYLLTTVVKDLDEITEPDKLAAAFQACIAENRAPKKD